MSTPESNGRHEPADADADADAGAPEAPVADAQPREPEWQVDEPAPRTELDIAFTPRQILGGFALLAALILLLRRRKGGGR